MLAVLAVAAFTMLAYPAGVRASSPEQTLGVYRGAAKPSSVAGFERWLGRPLSYSLDFFAMDNWRRIEDPGWWLKGWQRAKRRRQMIFSVPLLPGTGGTLAQGASGAYNKHFRRLARRLVRFDQADAILRPGWEFNGDWYRWAAASGPAAFAGTGGTSSTDDAFRARSAIQVRLEPNLGRSSPADRAYPGDAYVDYIGDRRLRPVVAVRARMTRSRWNPY